MLIAFVICLGIALVRFALVVATVPYAVYMSQHLRAEAKAAGKPAPTTPLLKRIAHSGPFKSWWGTRRVPYREGGDYLGVISHHSIARALGCVIGVLVERDRGKGVVFNRVIVPSDRVALYGEDPGSLMTLANGTRVRTTWGSLARDSAAFSDVPLVIKKYNPVLSAKQAAQLDATAGLKERTSRFYVGAPRPGGSGVWILYTRVDKGRAYLLIPLESSPAGDAL